MARLTGVYIQPNKAIVGENAFAHESGIHSDGIIKNAATYESITPELVGRKRRFVIGKHMGTHGLDVRLKELGVNVSKNQLKKICDNIKVLADKKATEEEISAAYKSLAQALDGLKKVNMIRPTTYNKNTGNKTTTSAIFVNKTSSGQTSAIRNSKTGDTTQIAIYVIGVLCAIIVFAGLVIARRKRNR